MSWKDKLPSCFGPDLIFAQDEAAQSHARDILIAMLESEVPFEQLESYLVKYMMAKGASKDAIDQQVERAKAVTVYLP